MQIDEKLVKQIVTEILRQTGTQGDAKDVKSAPSMAGRERINAHKTDYSGYPRAKKGTDPKEIVIGVGAAFQKEIKRTICDIPLEDVLRNVKAGIEEEGMRARVVKILDTSDVCFMALEAAKLSGSGIGVGIQSKGTTVIHQKDLYPLHNCIWLKIRLILAYLLKVTGNKLCVRHSIQLVKTRKLIVKLMIAESNRIIANLVHQIYYVLALGYSTQRSALDKIAHRHNTYICIGF